MENYLVRLANHANMTEREPKEESLVWNLWQAQKTKKFPDVKLLCEDVLNCLEYANHEVNGPVPSEEIGGSEDVPRMLSMCVCAIAHACYEYAIIWEKQALFSSAQYESLRQCAWLIMDGWLCILHGDIDSIASDVQLSGELKEIL